MNDCPTRRCICVACGWCGPRSWTASSLRPAKIINHGARPDPRVFLQWHPYRTLSWWHIDKPSRKLIGSSRSIPACATIVTRRHSNSDIEIWNGDLRAITNKFLVYRLVRYSERSKIWENCVQPIDPVVCLHIIWRSCGTLRQLTINS